MGLKKEQAQRDKARQEVKKKKQNQEAQMLYEGNARGGVGWRAVCGLVGQEQFNDLWFTGEQKLLLQWENG